ncbi:MAG: nitroreductase family protein, partial [Acidimicrobiaceae bacterium]|nr:nitroreductase family protein [Acidimicrobiaceae bacterium]
MVVLGAALPLHPREGIAHYGKTVQFQDVVGRRRMVRDFSDEPVARTLVEQLLANATRGPSAG